MNLFDQVYEVSDYEEDLHALKEPYFQLDPFETYEIDLIYAQGEM